MIYYFFTLFLFVSSVVFSESLDVSLRDHIHYNSQGSNQVGLIVIDDKTTGINQVTWMHVKAALDEYKKTKPAFIILELNTPGGEVYPAQQISDALKDLDTQYNIPVVAYINNWAISAGAMLAYSCRYIAIVKDASMGAAEPIYKVEGKTQEASEKVNSAMRADFANRAAFFGRNPLIAEAMVDKDILLVLRDGKITKLDSEAQIKITEPNPDEIISPKGKLLTLNAEEMMRLGVADILLLPEKLPLITPEEREKGIWPAEKELLFQYPFFKQIPDATIHAFTPDWKNRFFAILANPIVSSILLLGLMLGGYIEMSTPGFGFAGSIAFASLFLILLSSFAQQAVNWLEIILFISGLLIILVDLFVLPTFGFLGFFGALLLLGGLFALMLPGIESVNFDFETNTWNAAGEFVLDRLVWLSGAFVVGVLSIAALAKYIAPRSKTINRFVLKGHEQMASSGYHAGENAKKMPKAGEIGIVSAPLRPSGKVLIDGMMYDAVTSGDYIESGAAISVVYLDGSALVVERHSEGAK